MTTVSPLAPLLATTPYMCLYAHDNTLPPTRLALILYLFVTKTCRLFSHHVLFFLLISRRLVIYLNYHTIFLCFLFTSTTCPLFANHAHVFTNTRYMLSSEDLSSVSPPHDHFLSALILHLFVTKICHLFANHVLFFPDKHRKSHLPELSHNCPLFPIHHNDLTSVCQPRPCPYHDKIHTSFRGLFIYQSTT